MPKSNLTRRITVNQKTLNIMRQHAPGGMDESNTINLGGGQYSIAVDEEVYDHAHSVCEESGYTIDEVIQIAHRSYMTKIVKEFDAD